MQRLQAEEESPRIGKGPLRRCQGESAQAEDEARPDKGTQRCRPPGSGDEQHKHQKEENAGGDREPTRPIIRPERQPTQREQAETDGTDKK